MPPKIETISRTTEDLALRYDGQSIHDEGNQTRHHMERRILEGWLKPHAGGRILDLACGSGRLLHLASHGLDASLSMVRQAARKHPKKPVAWNRAERIKADAGSFDAVFCMHLFPHLDPKYAERVLLECYRVIRPGGMMIFDMPAPVTTSLARRAQDQGRLSLKAVRHFISGLYQVLTMQGIWGIGNKPGRLAQAWQRLAQILGRTPIKFINGTVILRLQRM